MFLTMWLGTPSGRWLTTATKSSENSLGSAARRKQDKLTDHFVQYYGIVLQKEQYKELKFSDLVKKLAELDEEYPGLTEAQTFIENPNPPKAHVLIRGDFRQPGVEVQPGTPAILPPLPQGPEPARLRLARWVVSRNNPLTARVTVNRMWNEFFGQGLVATSEDFGTRGDLPTHPALLDWLAATFMDSWLGRQENAQADRDVSHLSAVVRDSSRAGGA